MDVIDELEEAQPGWLGAGLQIIGDVSVPPKQAEIDVEPLSHVAVPTVHAELSNSSAGYIDGFDIPSLHGFGIAAAAGLLVLIVTTFLVHWVQACRGRRAIRQAVTASNGKTPKDSANHLAESLRGCPPSCLTADLCVTVLEWVAHCSAEESARVVVSSEHAQAIASDPYRESEMRLNLPEAQASAKRDLILLHSVLHALGCAAGSPDSLMPNVRDSIGRLGRPAQEQLRRSVQAVEGLEGAIQRVAAIMDKLILTSGALLRCEGGGAWVSEDDTECRLERVKAAFGSLSKLGMAGKVGAQLAGARSRPRKSLTTTLNRLGTNRQSMYPDDLAGLRRRRIGRGGVEGPPVADVGVGSTRESGGDDETPDIASMLQCFSGKLSNLVTAALTLQDMHERAQHLYSAGMGQNEGNGADVAQKSLGERRKARGVAPQKAAGCAPVSAGGAVLLPSAASGASEGVRVAIQRAAEGAVSAGAARASQAIVVQRVSTMEDLIQQSSAVASQQAEILNEHCQDARAELGDAIDEYREAVEKAGMHFNRSKAKQDETLPAINGQSLLEAACRLKSRLDSLSDGPDLLRLQKAKASGSLASAVMAARAHQQLAQSEGSGVLAAGMPALKLTDAAGLGPGDVNTVSMAIPFGLPGLGEVLAEAARTGRFDSEDGPIITEPEEDGSDTEDERSNGGEGSGHSPVTMASILPTRRRRTMQGYGHGSGHGYAPDAGQAQQGALMAMYYNGCAVLQIQYDSMVQAKLLFELEQSQENVRHIETMIESRANTEQIRSEVAASSKRMETAVTQTQEKIAKQWQDGRNSELRATAIKEAEVNGRQQFEELRRTNGALHGSLSSHMRILFLLAVGVACIVIIVDQMPQMGSSLSAPGQVLKVARWLIPTCIPGQAESAVPPVATGAGGTGFFSWATIATPMAWMAPSASVSCGLRWSSFGLLMFLVGGSILTAVSVGLQAVSTAGSTIGRYALMAALVAGMGYLIRDALSEVLPTTVLALALFLSLPHCLLHAVVERTLLPLVPTQQAVVQIEVGRALASLPGTDTSKSMVAAQQSPFARPSLWARRGVPSIALTGLCIAHVVLGVYAGFFVSRSIARNEGLELEPAWLFGGQLQESAATFGGVTSLRPSGMYLAVRLSALALLWWGKVLARIGAAWGGMLVKAAMR